jgi:hypothetical protein
MKKYFLIILLACAALASAGILMSTPTLDSSRNDAIVTAPEIAELALAAALLSPPFGCLLVKRKK